MKHLCQTSFEFPVNRGVRELQCAGNQEERGGEVAEGHTWRMDKVFDQGGLGELVTIFALLPLFNITFEKDDKDEGCIKGGNWLYKPTHLNQLPSSITP